MNNRASKSHQLRQELKSLRRQFKEARVEQRGTHRAVQHPPQEAYDLEGGIGDGGRRGPGSELPF